MNPNPFGYLPQPQPPKQNALITVIIVLVVFVVLALGACEAALILGVFEPPSHNPADLAPAPSR